MIRIGTSRFSRAALLMMVGTALSQIIALGSAPLLTRLYEPAVFGVFATVVALAGILAIPATLRYELAILLPERDEDARTIALGAIAIAFWVTVGVMAVMMGAWYLVPAFGTMSSLGLWLFAIPPLAFCVAVQSTAVYVANREHRYGRIVCGNLVQQAIAALLGVGFGLGAMKVGGLYLSRLAGYISASATLGVVALVRSFFVEGFDRTAFRDLAARYRQFPVFNVAYSLLGVLSRDFPVLALTAFGLVSSAGHFALARIAATFPANFLTASISQVFYREAAEKIDTPPFQDMIWNLMRALAFGLVPFFLLAALWSSPLFPKMLGENWRETGHMFALLASPMTLALLTGWPERIFEIRAKQYWSLAVQFVFDSMVVVSVTALLFYGYDIDIVLTVFAAILSGYQLTYLALVFVLTGLGLRKYCTLLAMLAAVVAGMLLGHFGAGMVLTPIHTFLASLVLAGSFSAIGLRFGLRVL
ncbi:hypothetical protein [Pseudorhodoplanes sp.]|uniref:hypothetical protein n=1 Tax=Pseudorhodoplanes sp. TaxID=1934341 RepID=UPI002CDD82DC|nr:hypothetical protein [Pseudorhodoplanes sp.]HWV44274.1 hypothetical protein [Pseudorhodoplanes sp.]